MTYVKLIKLRNIEAFSANIYTEPQKKHDKKFEGWVCFVYDIELDISYIGCCCYMKKLDFS